MFTVENRVVKPNTETLLIPVFREVWERDGSDRKETAMKELAYIEFMVSPRPSNPYLEYGKDTKEKKITADLFDKKWKPDDKVLAAIDWYEEWYATSSVAVRLYKASIQSVNSLIDYLEDVDFKELNNAQNLIHKPEKLPDIIEKAEKSLKALQSLKKRILEDDFDQDKLKGGKEVSDFEKV